MDVNEYRKTVAAELDKEIASSAQIAGSVSAPVGIADEIAILRDQSHPSQTRLNALRNVQTATFMGPGFDPYRASFREALRAVATEDKDSAMRTSALETLAFDKDDQARKLLQDGFADPSKAVVPPAKALQLLGQDDHGVALPIAREVASNNKYGTDAKEEALRILSFDQNSEGLLATILADKAQPEVLRTVSATGLRTLNPQSFAQIAQKIVVDGAENDSVRATCLGALNHIAGYSTKPDANFTNALSKLNLSGMSSDFQAAAKQYLGDR
jgi:hypothetical protein